MRRAIKALILCAVGGAVLQFGGCVAGGLSDFFFAVGPLIL
jgi:hypothetical protein